MTARQKEVLTRMRDRGLDLVYERGVGYVGYQRVGASVVMHLIRMSAVSASQGSRVGEFERYRISETGLKLLAAGEAPQ